MEFKKVFIILTAVLFFTAGCSGEINNSVLSAALEDLKTPCVQMDARFFHYGNALNKVSEYLDSPDDETLAAAKTVCADAIAEIAELGTPVSEITSEERAQLTEIGLNMIDYDIPFQTEDYYKYASVTSITMILNHLENAPVSNEALRNTVDIEQKYLIADRKMQYAMLNDLLCKFSDEDLGEFKTEFLPGLKSFSADNLPWETESDVIISKVNFWFEEIETEIENFSASAGEEYYEMLEKEFDLKNSLTEAGYAPEEAEAISNKVDALMQSAMMIE